MKLMEQQQLARRKEMATVGTVTSALAGVATSQPWPWWTLGSALAFDSLASTFGAGAATTGAGAATILESFLAAGILFDLETEEEDDIFNALVYSYHRRSCKPFSFPQTGEGVSL
jgi:hypothetical protein